MKTFITLAALAAAAIAVPVAAQVTVPETVSRAVHVADLNLNDPTHVARLDQRIERAAASMCRINAQFDRGARARERACVAEALTNAGALRDQAIAAAAQQSSTTITASR